jgi:hypothetical protein
LWKTEIKNEKLRWSKYIMWWYIMEGLKYKNRKCEGTYFGGYWDYV